MELVRAGHDRAFTTIVERYRRPLYLFARRLNSDGNAEDVVQQAFLGAFSALRAGAEVHHLRGWLHRIVRNAAITTAARAPQEAVSSTVIGAAGGDGDAHLVAVSALEEVSRLPERQRDALVATALQGRSRSDVARSMG
ncbi:MAG: RNA polymerase sigma factor, partial [Solirubrobacteraceae bacterium]